MTLDASDIADFKLTTGLKDVLCGEFDIVEPEPKLGPMLMSGNGCCCLPCCFRVVFERLLLILLDAVVWIDDGATLNDMPPPLDMFETGGEFDDGDEGGKAPSMPLRKWEKKMKLIFSCY
jgi:hypothetical protein